MADGTRLLKELPSQGEGQDSHTLVAVGPHCPRSVPGPVPEASAPLAGQPSWRNTFLGLSFPSVSGKGHGRHCEVLALTRLVWEGSGVAVQVKYLGRLLPSGHLAAGDHGDHSVCHQNRDAPG